MMLVSSLPSGCKQVNWFAILTDGIGHLLILFSLITLWILA